MDIKRGVAAAVLGLGVVLGVTGCYAKGEVMEVEIEQGEHGEVKELEVAREEGAEPESFDVNVDVNSPCDKGDIYPDCKEG